MLAEHMADRWNRQAGPAGATPARVLVLGMGATGASCARFLAARGVSAQFADTRAVPPRRAEILDAMPGASLQSGGPDLALADSIETVVVSPGVPLDLPVLEQARRQGLRIVSDIDLFREHCRVPLIAVTGSNGKSTVTSMLGAALRTAGWDVRIGGNLGQPALDLLDPAAEAYVLELSSFQLERSGRLDAQAAVILNLSPDHLDAHADLASYGDAKLRIYDGCEHAVVNRDQPVAPALSGAVTGFTLHEPAPGDFGLRVHDGKAYLAVGEALLLPVDELGVSGRHNVANALAALALGAAIGVDLQGMVAGLRRFTGLPHRMQQVCSEQGVTWIDDSKATNVAAAIASIQSVDGPLVLIAGGDAKGADFVALADALRARGDSVAVLLGCDRERLANALDGVCAVQLADDMATAVAIARSLAKPGTTVLLAPACASLDMYTDYAARGDAFVAAVTGGRE